ncbi:MAG: hypothetical protein HY565_01445 [Candidatus Kerfeldbacteria bacterium]|nr:hypothetical protein [Candidatus Kerfeldbacteria bacterium]
MHTKVAQADVATPGYRDPGYCLEIVNLDAYPDYTFILDVEGYSSDRYLFEPGECQQLGSYNPLPMRLQLIAVPTERFKKAGLLYAGDKMLRERGALFSNVVDYSEPDSVGVLSVIISITDQAAITMTDDQLTLTKDEVVYRTVLGYPVTLPYVDQSERPGYSGTGLVLVVAGFILCLPILALVLLVILYRRRKKQRQ